MPFHRIEVTTSTSRTVLLQRLIELTEDLAGLHRELGQVLQAERTARVNTFHRSGESTIAAREREAEYASLDLTCTVFDVKAQIAALTEERDLLHMMIELANESG